jgi:hypothetical protein
MAKMVGGLEQPSLWLIGGGEATFTGITGCE